MEIDIASIKLTLSVAKELLREEFDLYEDIYSFVWTKLIREYLPNATITELMITLEMDADELKSMVKKLP